MDNRGIDTDPGWINRQIHVLERAIESLRSERRAAATTISDGNLTVTGGGDLVVEGGGSIVLHNGGGLYALHANGMPALYFGPYTVGGAAQQGLLILDPTGKAVMSGEYDTVNGERRVRLGSNANRLHSLRMDATDTVIGGASDAQYIYLPPGGDINLQPDTANGKTVVIGHLTTANAANCYLDSFGRVYRSTSSRRYKQDEHPAVIDVATVLALQPRIFRTIDEVDEEGEAAPTHVGFIAEEAADLGLEHWVGRDEVGEPESFAYAQWCVAQQAVLQAQQALIEAQQKQIDDLAAQVAALTATKTTTTPTTK